MGMVLCPSSIHAHREQHLDTFVGEGCEISVGCSWEDSWSMTFMLRWSQSIPSWVTLLLYGTAGLRLRTVLRAGAKELAERSETRWQHHPIFDRFKSHVRHNGMQSCILPIPTTTIVGLKLVESLAKEQLILLAPGCRLVGYWLLLVSCCRCSYC